MIIDFRTATPAELTGLPVSAVVVVGAGAAGLAVTLALEDAGRPVVLVESGGDPRDVEAQQENAVLNPGEVVGHPYIGLTGGRARVLGGATQLWLGQCTRLHPLDLAPRSWVAGSGWPLGLDDLAPWYDRAERWFELSGGGYGPDRWSEHPRLTPVPWSPDKLQHDFTEYTNVLHQGSRHRRRLERSSLVTVLQHATVARVVLDGDRATGVEVRALGGRSAEVRGRDVVLAGGAIENARVLMLSDPEGVGLGTGREATGRYLQDHPVVETLEVRGADPAFLQDRYLTLHRGRRRLYPKVRLAPEAQEREQLLDANAVFLHQREDPGLDAVRRILAAVRQRAVPENGAKDLVQAVGGVGALVRTAYRRYVKGLSAGARASRVTLQVWMEQAADPDSRVRLGSGRDPLGLPVAEVDWRVGEGEMRTSRALSRWVAEDLRRHGIAEVRELPPMLDDDAWRAGVTDACHPSGTTRMSADPREGVVDPHGQVHGVAGLHVAGSSVFPVAGYANPTLTTVALSLRLADRLASRA